MASIISKLVRKGLAPLSAAVLLHSIGIAAVAATLIALQADGSVVVRPETGEPVVVPSPCAAALEQRLPALSDPAEIQAAVAEVVSQFAPENGRLAGAIAAYALTLVPQALGWAVIAGAQEANPDASEDILVAAGPAPDTQAGGGLTNLTSTGGLGGGGTQENLRSASEIQ